MATKSKTQSKAKKKGVKCTFQPIHDVCPELVTLFDYMAEQFIGGTSGVTLRDAGSYVENMFDTITELIDIFGPQTTLADIERLDEIDDLDG